MSREYKYTEELRPHNTKHLSVEDKRELVYILLIDMRNDWSNLSEVRARYCLSLQLAWELDWWELIRFLLFVNIEARDDMRYLKQFYDTDELCDEIYERGIDKAAKPTQFMDLYEEYVVCKEFDYFSKPDKK